MSFRITKILEQDREINALAEDIAHRGGANVRARFVESQNSWMKYRRTQCLVASASLAGGSAERVAYLDCVVRVNRQYLASLTYLRKLWSQGRE